MAGNTNNAKIWQDAVSASKECPSIAVLEKIMEGSSPDPKTQLHVADCPRCQSEISMLRSFEYSVPSKDEGAAVAWIAAQLERNQQAGSAQPAKSVPVPFWRAMFRLPYMAAAAALAVAITLGISLYVNDGGRPPLNTHLGTDMMRSGDIRVTTPSGALSQAPDQLSWEAWPGAASYTVQMTGIDIDHTLVWQGQTAATSVTVTPDMKLQMRPGKPLEWTVTALDATGKELATGKSRFRVDLKVREEQ